MEPSKSKTLSKRHSVQIKNTHGRLQLVFSYGGKRHYLSLGVADTLLTRKAAEARAKLIETDIAYERFDSTLAKYKPQSVLSTAEPPTLLKPKVRLSELWQRYAKFKAPQLSQTTLARDYPRYESHIAKLPTDNIEDAVQIRDYLVNHCSAGTAKRCLINFSACCDWAKESGLIGSNPFQGMAQKVTLPKSQEDTDINPFTAKERDSIIEAFSNDKYYSFYTNFVRFLFSTGCRPSEAIALQWRHFDSGFTHITFEQAVTPSTNGLAVKKGLKTQERRKFPCNASLKAFLQSNKPENAGPDTLVFPNLSGGFIDFNNFRNRGWKAIIKKLGFEYRCPYQTRHTFITLVLEAGLDVKDTARLVGNSAEVIYRHYAGKNCSLVVPEI